jgi:AGZA family xanthine/uracil permease-like MFS transporter
VGPGVVPASIVAAMLARGIPFETVLGVEFLAGLAFLALAYFGGIRALVGKMPAGIQSAGQIAIGIYLLMAALRSVGLVNDGSSVGIHVTGSAWIFMAGLAIVFLLSHFKRLSGYAILVGTLVAAVLSWTLGLTRQPTQVLALPQIGLFMPDFAGAMNVRLLVDVFVLLYVVIVDVVSTLETIAKCTPELCDESGRLKNFDRSILMSGIVFMISPFLGAVPLVVFFESLGGTLSGARKALAGYLIAGGFAAMVLLAPLATLFPVYACVIGLAYIGYCIAKYAVINIRIDGNCVSRQTRYLIGTAVMVMLASQSLSMTVFALFAVYPLFSGKAGLSVSKWDIGTSVLSIALMASMIS